jgi:hypothetical protein
MALLIGALLAIAVGIFATSLGLDRDRAFYPTVMIVIALYYVLFAVMGGSSEALVTESLVGAVFIAFAAAGFRSSLWLVVVALAAHGVFDFVRGDAIINPGVPTWWPQFCLTYDLAAAAYLAWLLKNGRLCATI